MDCVWVYVWICVYGFYGWIVIEYMFGLCFGICVYGLYGWTSGLDPS